MPGASYDAGSITATATIEARSAYATLDELRARVERLERPITVKANADTLAAQAELSELTLLMEYANEHSRIDIHANVTGVSDAQAKLAALEKQSSGNRDSADALRSSLLALAPSLIPLAGVSLAGLAGLGTTLGGAATGLGAFAVVAKTDLKDVTTAVGNYDKATAQLATSSGAAYIKAVTAQKAALTGLTAGQLTAAQSLLALQSAAQKFSRGFDPQVFKLTAEGAQILTQELPKVGPLVENTADSLQTLEDHAKSALTGPFYNQFLTYASTAAPKAVSTLGAVAGNSLTGVLGLIQGLDPITSRLEADLVRLSGRFSNFGKEVAAGDSLEFTHFLNEVENDAPKVEATLKSLGSAAITVGRAFAATGTAELPLIQGSAQLVTAIGKIDPQLLTLAAGAYTLNKALTPLGGGLAVFRDLSNLPTLLRGGTQAVGELATGVSTVEKVGAEGGIGQAALALGSIGGAASVAIPVVGGVALAVGGLAALWEHEKKANAEAAEQLKETAQRIGPIPDFTQFASFAQYTTAYNTSEADLTATLAKQRDTLAQLQANNNATARSRGVNADAIVNETRAIDANQAQLNLLNGSGSRTQQILGLVAAKFGTTKTDAESLAARYQNLTGRSLDLSGSAEDVAARLEQAGVIAQTTGGQVNGAATAFGTAAQQAQNYAAALDALLKTPADKLSAQVGYNSALTTTIAGLKTSGSLDVSTAAGQTNDTNLVALQKAAATLAETGKTAGDQASGYSKLSANIADTLKQAGLLTPALQAQLKQLNLTSDGALQAAKDSGVYNQAQLSVANSLSKSGLSASQVLADLQKLTPGLAAFVQNAEKYGIDAGQALASGFDTGIESGAARAAAVAADLSKGARTALKIDLKSASPSKETMKEGKNFADGVSVGIGANSTEVIAAATTLGTKARKALATSVGGTSKIPAPNSLLDPSYLAALTASTGNSFTKTLDAGISGGSAGIASALATIAGQVTTKLKNDDADRKATLAYLSGASGGSSYTSGPSTISQLKDAAQQIKYLGDQIKGTQARIGTATTARDAAQSTLDQTLSARDSYASSIAGTLTGEGSILTLGASASAPTYATILARQMQSLAQEQAFGSNLGGLSAEHLDPSIIAQIAQGGVSGGGSTAAALQNLTPAQVAQLNSVQGGITATANSIGGSVAATQYGPQIAEQTESLAEANDSLNKVVNLLSEQLAEQKADKGQAMALGAQIGATTATKTVAGINTQAKKAAQRKAANTKPKAGKVR